MVMLRTSDSGASVAPLPTYRHLPVLLPLVLSLLALCLTHLALREHEQAERDAAFAKQAVRLHERLAQRLQICDTILRGAAGLFASSSAVTRQEWHEYFAALRLEEVQLGIQGLGFTQRIEPQALAAHLREVRASGFPAYDVTPVGPRDQYSAIVYLEPFLGRNLRAFGFDMMSEPVRREAMLQARDQGDIAYSGGVRLMQETDADVQSGMLAYLPVYEGGMIPSSVAQRRALLKGWVYSPIRVGDLLKAVFQGELQRVRVRLTDHGIDGQGKPQVLFDSSAQLDGHHPVLDESVSEVSLTMLLHGRQWVLRYSAVPEMWPLNGLRAHWAVMAGVAVAGVLLCALTWSQANTRARAHIMAASLASELADGEERFRLMVDALKDHAIFMLDPKGVIISWNEGAERIKGWTAEEAIGRHYSCFYAEADVAAGKPQQALATALVNGQFSEEGWRLRKDGSQFRASVGILALCDAQGQVKGFAKLTRDITEAHEQGERLKLAATVFRSTQEGVVISDPQGRVMAVNPAFERITEYREADVLGMNLRLLSSGRHERAFFQNLWRELLETGTWQGEIWNRRKGGEVFPSWLAISTVRDDQQRVVNHVGVYTDITRIPHAETQMERLAHHDALTELPNRLLLNSRLAHTLERTQRSGGRCAVMFLDLDKFKPVNDQMGHEAGDELLKGVAKRLRLHLRDNDTVARIGGDEFVVVLEDLASAEGAEVVARAIIERMQRPFALSGEREAHIGCSVGIAMFPQDGADAETLLRHADAALYAAKAAGRGTFNFFSAEGGVVASASLG